MWRSYWIIGWIQHFRRTGMLLLIAISEIIQHNTVGSLQLYYELLWMMEKSISVNVYTCKFIHVNFLSTIVMTFEPILYNKTKYFAWLLAYLCFCTWYCSRIRIGLKYSWNGDTKSNCWKTFKVKLYRWQANLFL